MSDGFEIAQNYMARVAHAYGYEPNRVRGLPHPGPYMPRPGSAEALVLASKKPRKTKDIGPACTPKRVRKSRAKPKAVLLEQAA